MKSNPMTHLDPDAIRRDADLNISEFARTGDADDLDSLADGLLRNPESYDSGPEMARAVAAELRGRAQDLRRVQFRVIN